MQLQIRFHTVCCTNAVLSWHCLQYSTAFNDYQILYMIGRCYHSLYLIPFSQVQMVTTLCTPLSRKNVFLGQDINDVFSDKHHCLYSKQQKCTSEGTAAATWMQLLLLTPHGCGSALHCVLFCRHVQKATFHPSKCWSA